MSRDFLNEYGIEKTSKVCHTKKWMEKFEDYAKTYHLNKTGKNKAFKNISTRKNREIKIFYVSNNHHSFYIHHHLWFLL